MSQNVIELNGKRYDAITGAYLGKGTHPGFHLSGHGRVIDGFMRPAPKAPADRVATEPLPVHTAKAVEPPKPKPATTPHPVHRAQPTPKHVKAHSPEHAKTLMRRAVHKPEISMKPAIKTQAPAEMAAKSPSSLMHKRSVASVDPHRLMRATHANKHQAVRHFQPSHGPASHAATQHVPVIPVKTAPRPVVSHKRDIFEAAIAHASSHQQPHHKIKARGHHRRLVNTLAGISVFLVMGGFIGYLNLPGIELRVASIQAGFHASLPGYTPTGYALNGGIKRSGGTVTLSFRSGASHYTVTQQASDWNSQTLLDNTLALNGSHDTVQKNGQTIYVYDNGTNAAWVNGGVRYDVTGNAELSKEEIAAIATSL